MRPEDLKNGKQLRTDFEVDGKGFEWRSDHRRGSEDADPHAGGMNGVMIGNYLTSKCSDPQDDIAMLHDLGRTRTAPQV